MAAVTVTTCQGNDIEVHGAGCSDIAKKTRKGEYYNGCDTMTFPEGTTERDIWLDFNMDFLEDEGADGAWPIRFFPCAHAAGVVVDPDRTY